MTALSVCLTLLAALANAAASVLQRRALAETTGTTAVALLRRTGWIWGAALLVVSGALQALALATGPGRGAAGDEHGTAVHPAGRRCRLPAPARPADPRGVRGDGCRPRNVPRAVRPAGSIGELLARVDELLVPEPVKVHQVARAAALFRADAARLVAALPGGSPGARAGRVGPPP